MKALTVRGVPDDVYGALRQIARDNHRSLQEQITLILEREVSLVTGSRLAGRAWGNIAADIRRDRSR